MGDTSHHDGVSPMNKSAMPGETNTSEAATPSPPAAAGDATTRTPSKPGLSPSPSTHPNSPTSPLEAPDYLNNGLPHHSQSPVNGNSKPSSLLAPPASNDAAETPVERSSAPNSGPNTIRENGGYSEPASPGGRRSVQFARNDVNIEPNPTHSRNPSWDDSGRSISSAFITKLKHLTGSSSLSIPKSPSTTGPNDGPSSALPQSVTSSPAVGRGGSRIPGTLTEEGSDVDADAEETADEGAYTDSGKAKKKKKRMMRRGKKQQTSVPNTPDARYDSPLTSRRLGLRRRLSMPGPQDAQHGMSEGEGREQLAGSSWMRSAPWARSANSQHRDSESPSGRPFGHARAMSAVASGGVSDGDAMTPRRPLFGAERASTFGARQWKQVKNTLKLLRQKKEDRFDFAKSAELMAELRAGAPAALMLASMIQRDEHGNKRIPVLLEQVRIRVKDSAPESDDDSERHWYFTFDMEYGSGPSRMKWTIIRSVRDVYNLHVRYKLALSNDKYLHGRADVGTRPKQPRFPWAAFPYLRGARKKDDTEDDEMASVRGDASMHGDTLPESLNNEGLPDETADETDGRPQGRRKKSRLGKLGMRRRSTGFTDPGDVSALEDFAEMRQSRMRYVERQRKVLERYLQDMVRWLMFRADSNRLCKFLELSALGVRLAAEGSYHGKECYLHIQSSKGLDFRRVLTPQKVISRHSRKWFLVRSSYIVCVDSPENMNIYDVYLVDPKFRIVSKKRKLQQIRSKGENTEIDLTTEPPPDKHHTLSLHTAERKVKLFSRNQSVMKQFEDSIAEMLKQTIWHHAKRFESFAPPRQGVFAQWLVDGRDYMWNVSRAISMARDVIYIHDWWLSPELYMRRPPAISQKWRLDRLLQRKAREGVKIFIIVYRNVEAAIPIDSEYTKHALLNLHPNIFVQRSPNQFKKNQFFFAHHEKLCVVDHDIAFVGGIDLCFGRWDCPQHPCTDDKPTGFEQGEHPKDAQHCQLFPGKDYSNARVLDFFKLNEPYEEMYDRSHIPRMAWHDIGMQVIGQPARDLVRHFVQRWNYIRRGRNTTRPLPFLLPPPDCKPGEMEGFGLNGTCEVQILRSSCNWSLGIEEPECSIQNAYIKMIEDSDHFVYIENQFFITSTEVMNTKIANRIGDALVDRIIRAHENDHDWKACIVIPLMPGFQSRVDEQEGTSVRLILQCQFYSICRGENSIFGRLRAAGIEPEDYIQFYSLRQWGKMASGAMVTEQLYIHAKCIIVDDRVALIGSANINERSMRGDRDSELASIVRDTDMIWSTMAGKPYQVGRFAHTLRMRLMREHLGLDVDEILEDERQAELDKMAEYEQEMDEIYDENDQVPAEDSDQEDTGSPREMLATGAVQRPDMPHQASFNHDADAQIDNSSHKGKEVDHRVTNNEAHALEVDGYGPDRWKSAEEKGTDAGRDSVIINGREVLVHDMITEGKGTLEAPKQPHERHSTVGSLVEEDHFSKDDKLPPMPALNRRTTDQLGLLRANQLPDLPTIDDTDIGGPPVHLDANGQPSNELPPHLNLDVNQAHIDKDCMRDPVNFSFMDEIWNRVADNNTKIYRRVFRCMPDSEVLTWNDYNEYTEYNRKFMDYMLDRKPENAEGQAETADRPSSGGGAGAGIGAPSPAAMAHAESEKVAEKTGLVKIKDNLPNPKIVIPGNDSGDLNEKSGDTHGQHNTNEPNAKVNGTGNGNPEKTEPQSPSDIPPSPVLPSGEIPFPDLEPSGETRIEPQQEATREKSRDRRTTFSPSERDIGRDRSVSGQHNNGTSKRRRRATTRGSRLVGSMMDEFPSRAETEQMLNLIQGHLVHFPYDWLLSEEQHGNWGYQVDGVAPLQIYN